MGDIAPAFPPSFPQILVLVESIGNLAPTALEHNEKLIMQWLSRVAPSQNFDELGRKKTILDSSMIDPKTRKPIPQITLVKIEDVRKVGMLFSLLLSDVKIKFNGCAHELTRLHGIMSIEQMREMYPETNDEVLLKMISMGKNALEQQKKEMEARKEAEKIKEELANPHPANEDKTEADSEPVCDCGTSDGIHDERCSTLNRLSAENPPNE